MSLKTFKNTPIYRSLLTAGLLTDDDFRKAVFGDIPIKQILLQARGKDIRNTQILRKKVLYRESHGLVFRSSDIHNNTSQLNTIVNKELLNTQGTSVDLGTYRTILGRKGSLNKDELNSLDNPVFNLDYSSSAWATDASNYVADFAEMESKGPGWQVAKGSELPDLDDKKFKVWYRDKRIVVFLSGSNNREVFVEHLQRFVTKLKLKARNDLLAIQGTGKLSLEDIRNSKNSKYRYLPEIVFWLNGVLDIRSFETQGGNYGALSSKTGLQVGHITGIQAGSTRNLLKAIWASPEIGPDSPLRSASATLWKNKYFQKEVNLKKATEINASSGFSDVISLTVLETGNAFAGSQSSSAINKFVDAIKSSPEFTDFVSKALTEAGSPTRFDIIDNYFSKKWPKGGVTPYKADQRGKPEKLKIKIAEPTLHKINRSSAKIIRDIEEEDTASSVNLDVVLQVLNDKLAEQLRKNMGKGSAPKRLNWRTGRFARSAEILALLPTRGKTIEATITYLRNPYDVFLPLGRLHNDLRDPKKLIGKSLRQLLSEQFGVTSTIRTRLV